MNRNRSYFFSFKIASSLVPLLVLGTLVAVPLSARAQDQQDQDVATQPERNDSQKRDHFLKKELASKVPQDFEGALASITPFLEANPSFSKWNRIRLVASAGQVLYFSTPEAKRATVAAPSLKFLDDEIQAVKVREKGAGFQSWATKELLDSKVKILLAEKRTPEALAILEQWKALSPGYQFDIALDDSFNWGENWRSAQHQLNQPDQALSGLIKEFENGLLQRTSFAQGTVTNIVSELLEQGKNEEALSWAKLAFSLCPFDKRAIEYATKDVNRCLSMSGATLVKVNQFAAAQTDPAAPNPLDGVKLPQFDTTAIRAQLANATPKTPFERRLIELLALGDYRNAMLQAKSQMVSDVTKKNTALQVARVFKAKDGNIVRANQFLNYYQTGQGDNPIVAFLKETEAAPVTN